MPPPSELYTTIYNAVTFAAFTTLIACAIILILLLVAGIIWSPIAALICGAMARRRGLPATRYALAACSYSAQFLIPWTYLSATLHGNPTNRQTSRIDYILIYTLWAVVSLGYIGVFAGAFIHPDGEHGPFGELAQSGTGRMSTHIAAILIAFPPIPTNVFLFQKTLRDLLRKRREDRRNAQNLQNPPNYDLPHKAYTRPFSMTLLGSALICLSWLTVTILYWLTVYPLRASDYGG